MSSTNDYAGPGATQTGPGSYVLPSTTISTTVQPGNYFDKPGGFGGKVGANYAGSPDGFGITIKVRQKLNSTFGPLIKKALQEQGENYEAQLKSIPKIVEYEISVASGNTGTNNQKSDKDFEREISIRQDMIKNKMAEVQSNTAIANSFYGRDFLSKEGISFFQEAIGRWGTNVSTPDESFTAWLKSLNSAHQAKLLNEEISLLHKQIADLKVEAEAVRVANTFPAQGSVAISHPLFTAARGTIAIEGGAAALAAAIRSAIVGLAGLVAGAVSSAAVGVIAFLSFPRELANGELPDRYTFSTPLADMAPDLDLQTLQQAAATTGTVDLSIRVNSKTAEDGRSEVFAVQTDGVTVPSKVRVVAATYNAGQNVYTATTADVPPRTLTWTPAVSPGNSSTSLPAETALPPIYIGATITPVDGRIDTFPKVADASFDDYIMILPVGTGFVPVYVMFNSPYGETNAKGHYSGRDYNTNKAGGPILDLDWRTATIDQAGVNKVKLHTSRFGESLDNKVMIDRLERILKGELQITDIDKRFYTHEIRELERYRNLGVKDGEIPENRAEVWNNTHTATLEDYKVNERTQPLYTPEAEESYFK